MIIIDASGTTAAAATSVDAASLEAIVDKYDMARSETERNTLLAEAFETCRDALTSMVLHASKGRISRDDAENFALRALHSGLENSGLVSFTVRSAYWEYIILDKGPIGSEIWKRLTLGLRQMVMANPQYIKQPTIQGYVNELNGMIRDRQFVSSIAPLAPLPADARSMAANASGLPTSKVTELGAACVAAAFPKANVVIPHKGRNLLAYVRNYSIPHLLQEIWKESGSKLSRHELEVLGELRPYVRLLDELKATGKIPEEIASKSRHEQIYILYRKGLERLPLGWYEQRVERIQKRPFKIRSPADLSFARQLLIENGVEQSEMPRITSKNLKAVSLEKAVRVLELAEGTPQAPQKPTPPMATQPSRGSVPTETEDAAVRWLSRGHASPAYAWMVGRLYERGSIESEVGNFLARNPSPSRPMIADFAQSLSEQNEDDLNYAGGFQAVALAIDKAVLDGIRSPEMRQELEKVFTHQTINAALDSMHRGVLLFKYAAYFQKNSMLKSA